MKTKFLIPAILLFAACSSLKVTYDYDSQTDFTKFKTYAYSEDALKLPVGDLNRDRVFAAIDRELAAKGFSKSDNPDVLIDLHVRAEQKTEAVANTTGPGYYGGPWRYGYGGGFSTTTIDYNQYIEGTLFVNMVDKSTDKIVWQGRGTKTIDEDASAQKRETNINNGVKLIFSKYPPQKK